MRPAKARDSKEKPTPRPEIYGAQEMTGKSPPADQSRVVLPATGRPELAGAKEASHPGPFPRTFVRFVSLAGDIFDRSMYVQGEKSDVAKSITPLQYRKLQS